MPKRHNLTNRNGVWYYRRRVPKKLKIVFGKTDIQFSLKTKDFNEAAKRRNIQDVEWDARFDQAQKQPEAASHSAPTLSRDEALRSSP